MCCSFYTARSARSLHTGVLPLRWTAPVCISKASRSLLDFYPSLLPPSLPPSLPPTRKSNSSYGAQKQNMRRCCSAVFKTISMLVGPKGVCYACTLLQFDFKGRVICAGGFIQGEGYFVLQFVCHTFDSGGSKRRRHVVFQFEFG